MLIASIERRSALFEILRRTFPHGLIELADSEDQVTVMFHPSAMEKLVNLLTPDGEI